MEKIRRWVHRGLCVVVMGNIFAAYRCNNMGDILEAIYFMMGAVVALMMVSMTEDYDD